MTENNQLLFDEWDRYAARTAGFIGAPLQAQRHKAFLTQEQQRALLGILDTQYDSLWLKLQAMPLPRMDQFMSDLEQIVTKAGNDIGIEATVNMEHFGKILRRGLE